MTPMHRLRVAVRGAVQGVGFRPFIYRLAGDLKLGGWVANAPQGVFVEVEGPMKNLQDFLLRLGREKPPRAFIQSLESSYLDPVGYESFEIRPSLNGGHKTTLILPDIATCGECLQDLFDPANRRYRYPFTNCAHCGPRFSIIKALPYDRRNTTMRSFKMCADCQGEYDNPLDRRFHAQPNACPACGPQLAYWNGEGLVQAAGDEALGRATAALREGLIIALKGIGGYQLLVDAKNPEAVRRLRQLKHREEKPFALMYPSLEGVRRDCEVSPLEERLLQSPESPVVLLQTIRHTAFSETPPPQGGRHLWPGASVSPDSALRRRTGGSSAPARGAASARGMGSERNKDLWDAVAPGNPYLGVMLPYSPLHHLLMAGLNIQVVATSGNISEEPICIDDEQALIRLRGIADGFLTHNRPIARHVDDSVVRILLDRELVIRRARGYAPLPISLKEEGAAVLAVGAHLKNTVALASGKNVFVSQHIGDLETEPAYQAFQRVIGDLEALYQETPALVACDMHPHYQSTHYADHGGRPVLKVQHHYAHVLSCMTENELAAPVLGIAWDGTGYGLDGTVWGGEFLRVTEGGFDRMAHLRTFPLPGGDQAVREPRRAALGLLYEIFGNDVFAREDLLPLSSFSKSQRDVLKSMLRRKLNSPLTSSAGRLFDGVSSLAGLRQVARFEGQAAMELEFAATLETSESYPIWVDPPLVDWEPMLRTILDELQQGVSRGLVSAKFHNALAEAIVRVALRAGLDRVVLTGGCFQNRFLIERAVQRLRQEGFHPYWHQRIPTNDGGIALGQAVAAVSQGVVTCV